MLVFSDTHIDVFDCQTGDWLQTLNVKKARPLNLSGSLTTCIINDMPYVIYLSNIHQCKFWYLELLFLEHQLQKNWIKLYLLFLVAGEQLNLVPLDASGWPVSRSRRRFSLREGNRAVRPTDRRSKMISAPTNFNHITHMGPGNGIQVRANLTIWKFIELKNNCNEFFFLRYKDCLTCQRLWKQQISNTIQALIQSTIVNKGCVIVLRKLIFFLTKILSTDL